MNLADMFTQTEFPVGFLLLCGIVALAAALLALGILIGANWGRNLRR